MCSISGRLSRFFAAAACCLIAVPPVPGDVVRLKNGGEVRGEVERGTAGPGSTEVVMKTVSGAVVSIARGDVEFVTHRPLRVEQYETRSRQIPNTIEAHWELAEWCRENYLKDQRAEQLEQIVSLDPDHEEAHRGLGHALRNGVWMTREEDMRSRGYVYHGGEWVTQQELELLELTQAERDKELAWLPKVRLWHNWLTGRHPERGREAYAELSRIDDPYAVHALQKFFSEDANDKVRRLYVGIVGRIPGSRAAGALARQSLNDPDHEIRYESLNGLGDAQRDATLPIFIGELKNDSNTIVCRAGRGLERVGDERAVPYLIDALVTTHTYRVRVQDHSGFSFGSNGSFGAGANQSPLPPEVEAGLRTGQYPYGVIVNTPGQPRRFKLVTINVDHQNREVLTALQKITGQGFSFDERTWGLWWNSEKSGAAEGLKLP